MPDRPELWEVYRSKLRKYDQEIINAKREGWKNFCNKMKNQAEGARIYTKF